MLAGLFLVSMPLVFSCDTGKTKHPYIIINVNFSGTVNSTNKLYVIFYYLPNWTSPWLILDYSSKVIMVPSMNIGTIPIYFEIVYDVDGNGVDSGDYYQGWYNVTNPLDPVVPPAPLAQGNLAPLVLLNTDMVMINFDLDRYNTIP